jgi:hypothetical protein
MRRLQKQEEAYIKRALKRLGLRWFLFNLGTILLEKSDLAQTKQEEKAWRRLADYLMYFGIKYQNLDKKDDK